jgi:hypothetical protein
MAKIADGAAGRKIPWAIEPGSESDRCATKPTRPRVRTVAGAAWASPDHARLDRGRRAEVIAVQQEIFVGIDVSKKQLEVALSTGEGFAIGNDQG